ncbi:MAG: hypothetical protein OEY89_03070 [Gammaproteobacteria bacterium]|nr:hypothetical protein [Gammaproteobacteria bacterium]
MAAFFACLILVFSDSILGNLSNWDSNLSVPLATTVLTFLFQDYVRRELFSKDQTLYGVLIDILCYGSRLIILFIYAFNDHLDVYTTLVIISVTSAFSFIFFINRSLFFAKPDNSSLSSAITIHWNNGKWLLLNTLSIWLSSQLILYMTGFMLTTGDVGMLVATQNILGFANILFQAMENFVPSQASKTYSSSGITKLNQYLKRITLIGGTGTLLIILIICIFSRQLLDLVYSDYQDAYWLVWFWGLYFLMGFFRRPLTAGLRVLNDTKSIFIASTLGAFFTIIIGYILILRYGITGTMISLCLVQLIILLTLFYNYNIKSKQTG